MKLLRGNEDWYIFSVYFTPWKAKMTRMLWALITFLHKAIRQAPSRTTIVLTGDLYLKMGLTMEGGQPSRIFSDSVGPFGQQENQIGKEFRELMEKWNLIATNTCSPLASTFYSGSHDAESTPDYIVTTQEAFYAQRIYALRVYTKIGFIIQNSNSLRLIAH